MALCPQTTSPRAPRMDRPSPGGEQPGRGPWAPGPDRLCPLGRQPSAGRVPGTDGAPNTHKIPPPQQTGSCLLQKIPADAYHCCPWTDPQLSAPTLGQCPSPARAWLRIRPRTRAGGRGAGYSRREVGQESSSTPPPPAARALFPSHAIVSTAGLWASTSSTTGQGGEVGPVCYSRELGTQVSWHSLTKQHSAGLEWLGTRKWDQCGEWGRRSHCKLPADGLAPQLQEGLSGGGGNGGQHGQQGHSLLGSQGVRRAQGGGREL